jgi:hypothetical protein
MKHVFTASAAGLVCGNPGCINPIERRARGRPRRFCSDDCRVHAFRNRVGCNEKAAKANDRAGGNGQFVTSTINNLAGDFGRSLEWIEVNDVTWKLTDGVMERTPACHGKWGGFNIERGLAWVIDVGWPFGKSAWYARCGDRSYGPTDLRAAKEAARAFVTGAPLTGDEHASAFVGPVNLNVDARSKAS